MSSFHSSSLVRTWVTFIDNLDNLDRAFSGNDVGVFIIASIIDHGDLSYTYKGGLHANFDVDCMTFGHRQLCGRRR